MREADLIKEQLSELDDYLTYIKRRKATGTIKLYESNIRNAIEIIRKPFPEWTNVDLSKFLDVSEARYRERKLAAFEKKKEEGYIDPDATITVKYSDRTNQTKICAIHSFFNHLKRIKKGFFTMVDFKDEDLIFRYERDFISEKRVSKDVLFEFIGLFENVKYKTMLTTCYVQLLRISEAIVLTLGDLDFEKNTMAVYSVKTNKKRNIPLDAGLKPILFDYILERFFDIDVSKVREYFDGKDEGSLSEKEKMVRDTIYSRDYSIFMSGTYSLKKIHHQVLFPTRSGKPYEKHCRTIHRKLANMNRKHDFTRKHNLKRRITTHFFRGNGATERNIAGMPIERLRLMIGHSRLETTKLYCMPDMKIVNDDIQKTSFIREGYIQ